MKRALITGITGQDGSYLADFLLTKGYSVYGMARRENWFRGNCAKHLDGKIEILYGDITKDIDIANAVQEAMPDEIYNLAAKSRPAESWTQPTESMLATGLAPVRLYEVLRLNCLDCRLYQSSSSEMFGQSLTTKQNEQTPVNPVNPYGAAKGFAHQMAGIYRDGYGLHISTGILFNHESERRPLHYLSQKVAYGAACSALGIRISPDLNERGKPIVDDHKLALGNLEVARDWGYAPDYVRAMWLILQHDRPDDFVVGTGQLHTLRELCEITYQIVGRDWQNFVVSDPALIRPLDAMQHQADASKVRELLGWAPTVSFEEMMERMVRVQIERLQRIMRTE